MLRAVLVALAVATLGATACGEDSGSSGAASGPVTGTFSLKQLNGQGTPVGISGRLVIDGTFELKADATWSIRLSWRGEFGTSRYTGDDGTFSRSGGTLNFRPKSMAPFTGRVGSDGGLTVEFDFDGDGKLERFLFAK